MEMSASQPMRPPRRSQRLALRRTRRRWPAVAGDQVGHHAAQRGLLYSHRCALHQCANDHHCDVVREWRIAPPESQDRQNGKGFRAFVIAEA